MNSSILLAGGNSPGESSLYKLSFVQQEVKTNRNPDLPLLVALSGEESTDNLA